MSHLPIWALAFSTSVVLTLLLTPLLRRLALTTGLVDKPGDHKSHHIPTPYLGGVGVTISVLAGLALDSRLSPRVAAVVISAALLGTVGLLDDDRTVDPRLRFLVQFGAAGAAVAVGIRVHATGVAPIDVAITIIWIVGVTNALNLLDNMDGLATGVAAAAAATVFPLAILAQQPVVATLAAAVVGACAGFLVYNRSPASIFLGDVGSLFLGFVIAILTVDVTPSLAPPFGFVVPLIILGLPVLDTTTVTLGRLRRGRSPLLGGRDHLSHRLVARGLTRGNAVLVLVGVQVVLGILAVLGGRRVVQLRWVALVAFAVLALLAVVTSRVKVYEEPVVGLPRTLRLALGGLAVAVPIISLPAVLAMTQAAGAGRDGVDAVRRAMDALGGSNAAASATDFDRAGRAFADADDQLDGPLVSIGLAVPGVSSNLRATRTLASIGQQLSDTGGRLAHINNGVALRVSNGSVPLDQVRSLAVDLSKATAVLRRSQERLDAIDRPFLLPPLQRVVRELDDRVTHESRTVALAASAAEVLPAVLGADGPRRYFVAFQNNAELRGSGGLIANWAELVADKGRMELSRFGTLQDLTEVGSASRTLQVPVEFQRRWLEFKPELWEQVNISPDFPTTARLITDLYPQSGGQPVDGVIALDAVGLSALLELTGPVMAPNWPDPITAANVVDVTTRDAYERFPAAEENKRIEFLSDLSRQAAEAFTTVDLGNPRRLAEAMGKAAGAGHLLIHLNAPEEQQLVRSLRSDGGVPQLSGDSLMIVNQNMSANKVDSYLRRRLRYEVRLDPRSRPAELTGRVEVTLQNDAPAVGVPEGLIGPHDDRRVAGENRTYISVYSPFPSESATLNGVPVEMMSRPDLGRHTHSTTISIPPLSTRVITTDVKGRVRLSADGWYRLDILHQPTLAADEIEVSVDVPQGWRIVEARGAEAVGDRRVERNVALDRQHTIWVQVDRTSTWARTWDRLRAR